MSQLDLNSDRFEDADDDVLAELPRSSGIGLRSSPNFRAESHRDRTLKYDAGNDMIFALDEDTAIDNGNNAVDAKSDESSDDDEVVMNNTSKRQSGNVKPVILSTPTGRQASRQTSIRGTGFRNPSASLAISLPVNIISNGFASRNDSFLDEDDEYFEGEDEGADERMDNRTNLEGRTRAKTILSTREDRMYRNIQAYSRSIQPADDPERLFGERPHRRYRPTEQSGGSSETRFMPFAANVGAGGPCSSLVNAPIIANDLNLITAGGRGAVDGGSSAGSNMGIPRVIIPSSYSGRF